jgi:hypothetical protein
MAKSDVDAAAAAGNTQGRVTMKAGEGTKFSAPSASPAKGKLMPRGNTAAGDPTAAGTKVARPNVPVSAAERNGASYTIITNTVKQTAPEASATLMNARVIPAITKRGFASGVDSSY